MHSRNVHCTRVVGRLNNEASVLVEANGDPEFFGCHLAKHRLSNFHVFRTLRTRSMCRLTFEHGMSHFTSLTQYSSRICRTFGLTMIEKGFPWLLRLMFSRDVCVKFSDDSELKEDLLRQTDNSWCVVGTYDFLNIQSCSALTELSGSVAKRELSFGAHRTHVLAPFDDFFDLPAEDLNEYQHFVDRVRMVVRNDHEQVIEDEINVPLSIDNPRRQENAVLVIARFFLSPVAYELEEEYEGVNRAATAARDLLLNEFSSIGENIDLPSLSNTRFFRSLGSPDVVLLSLPSTPSELSGIYQFLRRCRSLMLDQLVPYLSKNPDGETPESRKLQKERIPGHAFSNVHESLSFRFQENGQFSYTVHAGIERELAIEQQRAMEIEKNLRLDARLRVDCGHDATVAEMVANLNGAEVSRDRQYSGHFGVRARFRHLADFANFWRSVITNFEFRIANIVDSTTTPSFGQELDVPESHDHADRLAWKLNERLSAELSEIHNNLESWAIEFLSVEQREELMATVKTFRSCFYHHELPTATRDLLPFMLQLSAQCSPEMLEDWRRYRQDPSGNIEVFSKDVEKLLTHLHRAVRNRLEHRSRFADPTFPYTLAHGASKIINAYSTYYWLCSELFASDKTKTEGYCDANRMAVCVAAGSEGRVKFDEVFEDFRTFCMEKHRTDKETNYSPQQMRPLILVDISGSPMFEPEQAFIHAVHETVEFSDWLGSPNANTFKKTLRDWVTASLAWMMKSELKKEPNVQKSSKEAVDRMDTVIFEALKSFEGQIADTVAAPDKFLEEMEELIHSTLATNEFWSDHRECHALFDVVVGFIQSTKFRQLIDSLYETVEEIAADCGQLMLFQYIRSSLGAGATASISNQDIDLMYSGLIHAHLHRLGCGTATVEDEWCNFLLRWGVAQCVAGNNTLDELRASLFERLSKRGQEVWRSHQSDKFISELVTNYSYIVSPEFPLSLVKHFQVQDAAKKIGFPSLVGAEKVCSDAESQLIRSCFETWNIVLADYPSTRRILRTRLRLIMSLYAKATRLRHSEAFTLANP